MLSNPMTGHMVISGMNNVSRLGSESIKGGMGLVSQKRAFNQELKMQKNQFDFQKEMLQLRNDAFTEAGLPTFMGYGHSYGAPNMSQSIHGGNFYTSRLPGNAQSSPYIGTTAQNLYGWGNVQ